MRILFLIMLGISTNGCASMVKVTTLYSADNLGRQRCSPQYVNDAVDFTKAPPIAAYESYSGYRKCLYANQSTDTLVTECSEPVVFKSISTTVMAKCHEFLAKTSVGVK